MADILKEILPELAVECNFSFARHTTIGCGGTARVCAYPRTAEELNALLYVLRSEHIPYCFLGAGANVLPSEKDFNGVVIRFSRMQSIRIDGECITVGAGVTGGALCRFAREHGIGGFEPFTGIPMTVGGAIAMNAGIAAAHMSDVVTQVFCVSDRVYSLSVEQCGFSEKHSVFQSGIAVTGAVLRGKRKSKAEIERNTQFFRSRRSHLPKGRSMGCVFVNPKDLSAGKLIEDCDLKGARVGGAVVSERHANFILNEGATADDIEQLIQFIKKVVKEKTDILLREEIKRIT